MVSTAVIIIIAVCGVVGVFLFAFVAVRSLKRLATTSNPLPPVQPLAHHREHLVSTLPRSQTWYMTAQQLPVPQPLSSISTKSSSTTSLLTSKPSLIEASPASTSSPLRYENSLTPPSPSFHTAQPDSSTSSLGSSDPGHAPIPEDGPPPSGLPRTWSSAGTGNSARRKRPLSMSSSLSTVYSKASRNTLRGTPHGPHSRIEIILPTPLAGRQEADIEAVEVADRWT